MMKSMTRMTKMIWISSKEDRKDQPMDRQNDETLLWVRSVGNYWKERRPLKVYSPKKSLRSEGGFLDKCIPMTGS